MLTINNDGDKIADTNFWQTEYNDRGLAYLSANADALRLLIPMSAVADWLPEIKTGKRVLIEPPARAGYPNHIDVVFDDGTDSPFSICLDRTRQVDRTLGDGHARIIIYPGSLDNPIALPCVIQLRQPGERETYINHVTVNTGDSKRLYRADLPDDTMRIVSGWLPGILSGTPTAVYETDSHAYAVRAEYSSGKAAHFAIARVDAQMQSTDIARLAACRHSKLARPAWQYVNGTGEPPGRPFAAAYLINDNITPADFAALPVIGSFEQFLAWAWLESVTND